MFFDKFIQLNDRWQPRQLLEEEKRNHGRVMEAQVCFDIDASTQKARHRENER